ncbi:MAG: xylulokinase [Deltaproteobacteria bacterium]|nr:xylulokinase [Deltaproteobacteria bacterium]
MQADAYLGLDLGTSAVKALLLDDADTVVAEASADLEVSRPAPLWSEQDPEAWWRAAGEAVARLRARVDGGLSAVRGVGLSGQMHGATLLDASDRPLRPAILWNDGRSAAECAALEREVPESREITGNLAMPGFTAPKLLWVRRHEPDVFARVAHVLLPKDYLRLRMTGDYATDLSDASGTLWVDVARRCWSERMIAACGLAQDAMPALHEGTEVTGRLRAEVAEAWGCEPVPVVAGAGDQAAGAVGAGVVEPGRALLSLGTSGVYFVAGEAFRPAPESAVHAFCHALPGQWHQMSVVLSAASCLSWIARVTGAGDEAALLEQIEQSGSAAPAARRLLFLPYLSGERTPHNDPNATGVFVGIDHETDAAALGRAVLEGVAFAFADAEDALVAAGAAIDSVSVIGGGARSPLWGRILASVLRRPLVYRRGGEVGPALGAARLARLGVTKASALDVCRDLPEDFVAQPDASLAEGYAEQLPRFRSLYRALRDTFRAQEDPR